MLRSAILTDICSQLGDENKDTYEDRAISHFERAIFEFIEKKEYRPEDLQGYMKLKTDLGFTAGSVDIASLNILHIENIYPDPAVSKEVIVTIKNISELSKIAANDDLKPSDEDVFIYRVGTTLYCLVATSSNFTQTTDSLHIVYLEDIDTSGWTDTTDLADDFSRLFINKCIGRAVQTLKIEDDLAKAI